VAYATCPWCLSPQLVGDEVVEYRCFNCNGTNRFAECQECGLVQTVSRSWSAFTCSRCDRKGDLPREVSAATSPRARRAEGTGLPWPRF